MTEPAPSAASPRRATSCARRTSIVFLVLALVATAALPLASHFPGAWWILPLAGAVSLCGLVSFVAAIEARARWLAIVSGFVAFALIPLLYVAALLVGGP